MIGLLVRLAISLNNLAGHWPELHFESSYSRDEARPIPNPKACLMEKKMMQKACAIIAVIIPASLFSVLILISAVYYNVAQAKSRTAVASACGKELQRQCTGVPAQANNMLECLAKARVSARCHAVAQNVVRSCERDAVQFCQAVVAGQGNILGCLTAARGVVSAPCNEALDAAYLR